MKSGRSAGTGIEWHASRRPRRGSKTVDHPGGEDVTILLAELTKGNKEAASKLVPLVYDELRRLAVGYMRGSVATIRCKLLHWSTKRI